MRARPVPTYLTSSRAFQGAGVARHRAQTRDVTVVASSDQNGTYRKLISLAKSANLLIMHLAIAATAPLSKLHASQGRHLAQGAGARGLNHIGQFDVDAAVAKVRKILCRRTHPRCRSPVHAVARFRAIIGTLSTCAQVWPVARDWHQSQDGHHRFYCCVASNVDPHRATYCTDIGTALL